LSVVRKTRERAIPDSLSLAARRTASRWRSPDSLTKTASASNPCRIASSINLGPSIAIGSSADGPVPRNPARNNLTHRFSRLVMTSAVVCSTMPSA
jgi:hypothetical protein